MMFGCTSGSEAVLRHQGHDLPPRPFSTVAWKAGEKIAICTFVLLQCTEKIFSQKSFFFYQVGP